MLVVLGDRNDGIGNFVEVGKRLVVGVIGNDQRNVAGEFAALVAIQEIDQAVIVLGDKNNHARAMRGLGQSPVHLELFGYRREVLGEVGEVFIRQIDVEVFGIELNAHQEEARFLISMFVGVEDVAVMAVDEVSDRGDFALLIGTGDEEDGGGFHGYSGTTGGAG